MRRMLGSEEKSFLISNCRGREVEEGLGSAVVNCLGSV